MNNRAFILCLAVFFMLGLAGVAWGQVLPMKRTGSLIVTDTGLDEAYRCTDFNLDGDYNDANEIIFFHSFVTGSSSNPIKVTTGPKGYIYVSNTSTDEIWRLADMNGDGDADDVGDYSIYLDNLNASGITISSIQGMTFDSNGDLYLCNSGSSGVNDMILRLRDLNKDGDCQDSAEVSILYDSQVAAGMGLIEMGVPMPCVLDDDGTLYVSDVNDPDKNDPILKCKDINGDGDYYDTDELDYYYDDTKGLYNLSNVDSMAFTRDGLLLLNESLKDVILIGEDMNDDGDIEDIGELRMFRDGSFVRPDSSKGTAVSGENNLHWDVYIAEYSDPNGVHGMRDLDEDGDCDEPGELMQVYDDVIGWELLDTPKGLAFMKGPELILTGTPAIGNTIFYTVYGTPGHICNFIIGFVSAGGTYKLPPYGTIDFIPSIIMPYFPLDADGQFTLILSIPNDPGLVGLNYWMMSTEGDNYNMIFSNSLETTIQ